MPSSERPREPVSLEQGRVREGVPPSAGDGYGRKDPEFARVRRFIETASPERLAHVLALVAGRLRYGAR
jgi:hypothetical protein